MHRHYPKAAFVALTCTLALSVLHTVRAQNAAAPPATQPAAPSQLKSTTAASAAGAADAAAALAAAAHAATAAVPQAPGVTGAPSGVPTTVAAGCHGSGTSNPALLLWRVLDDLTTRAKPAVRYTYRAVGSGVGQKVSGGGSGPAVSLHRTAGLGVGQKAKRVIAGRPPM